MQLYTSLPKSEFFEATRVPYYKKKNEKSLRKGEILVDQVNNLLVDMRLKKVINSRQMTDFSRRLSVYRKLVIEEGTIDSDDLFAE